MNAQADRAHDIYEASLSPLHRAIRVGDFQSVQEIVREEPDQVRGVTGDDELPLELAVLADRPDPRIVAILLGAGAELAVRNDRFARRKSLLAQAVQVKSPRPEIIALLLQAGAEGFVPEKGQYAFETPFGHVVRVAEDPAVIDAFLQTGKLDPQSALAGEYLANSVREKWAFERMLAYGVPLANAPEVLPEIVSNATPDALREVLEHSMPLPPGRWREEAARALARATHRCKFDMADMLLNAGAADEHDGLATEMVRTISERCAEDPWRHVFSADELKSRGTVLRKLVAKGGDLNAVDDLYGCPAWLGGPAGCRYSLSLDEALLKDYLELGADPYRLNPIQEKTALGSALDDCELANDVGPDRPALLLTKSPGDGPLVKAGLDRSLNAVFGAHCSEMVRLDVADRLIAYGADINALNDRGGTNLGSVMFFKSDAVYQEAAEYLLAHGVPVDAVDNNGQTALYWLLDYEQPRMERVLWLVRHGARLQHVMNQPNLPASLKGPARTEILRQIEAAA